MRLLVESIVRGESPDEWLPPTESRRVAWYAQPLSAEDALAGGFLLLFGIVFLPLYGVVAYVMFKNDKDVVGFRFLFSASLADMLLLFNYAIWPAITILFKSEIVAVSMRSWIQIYLDWAWFSMCYHYMIIAWSRFAAIRFAHNFRVQTPAFSYMMCAGCYLLALIQVLVTHFQPWYVTFYYEPSAYGMLSEDFLKYLNDGQSLFFFTFHLLMMIIPIIFYSCALALLLKHRKAGIFNGSKFGSKSSAKTEARLIIPCIFNSIVFIIGQVVITIGTGEGKWATWMVLLLFSANSAANPVLLLTFSAIIRQKTMLLLMPLRLRSNTFSNTLIPQNSTSLSPNNLIDRRVMSSMVMKTEYHVQLHRQVSEPILAQDF